MYFASIELKVPRYHFLFRALLNPNQYLVVMKMMIAMSKWHHDPQLHWKEG